MRTKKQSNFLSFKSVMGCNRINNQHIKPKVTVGAFGSPKSLIGHQHKSIGWFNKNTKNPICIICFREYNKNKGTK